MFEYVLSLERPLSGVPYIDYIIFPISRYDKYQKVLYVDDRTEAGAVRTAQKYLSEKITREYYDEVKDDLSFKLPFENLTSQGFECRGDLLGDLKFIEEFQEIGAGYVLLRLGS